MGKTIAPDICVERIDKVVDRVGYSKSSIYNFVAEGTFPKPIKLGSRSVGWLSHEIDEWIVERIERRDRGHE